jgi:hypothetical protein
MLTTSRLIARPRMIRGRVSALALGAGLMALSASCGSATGGDPGQMNMTVASKPTVSQVAPELGPLSGGTTVSVYGSDFREGAQVKFGGLAATNVVVKSNVEISVTIPAWSGAIGPVEVSVDNSDGGRASGADLFSYVRTVLKFDPTLLRTVGKSPIAMIAADVTGDNAKELLVANNGDGTLSVLLNSTNFNPAGNPTSTPALPTAIAVGDINGDARGDVVLGHGNASSQDVSVLRGLGNGSFMTPDSFAVGGTVAGIAVRDINGDGKPDVAATVRTTNTLVIMNNNGAAPGVGFASPYTNLSVSGEPAAVVLADLNKDSRDDVVMTQYGSQSVAVLLASTTGGTLVTPPNVAGVGLRPIALTASEVTGDNNLDVVVANFDGNSLSLLRGQGDGSFGSVSTIATAEKPTAVAVADMNSDGKPDLLVSNSGRNQIWVLLGRGDGTFDPAQRLITGAQPWSLLATDLNGDSKPDVAVTNLLDGTVSIFINRTT